jgi:hypothetical protein
MKVSLNTPVRAELVGSGILGERLSVGNVAEALAAKLRKLPVVGPG